MATFKKGQRIRKIAHTSPHDRLTNISKAQRAPIGTEGTVIRSIQRMGHEWWVVMYDGYPSNSADGSWFAKSYQLAPLTDPKIGVWAADAVRKVTKPEPVAPKVPEKMTT